MTLMKFNINANVEFKQLKVLAQPFALLVQKNCCDS